MKIFLVLFVLLFSTSVFADDISDFQIEGISIGDSLLDYFSEEEIKKAEVNYYNNNEIVPIYIKDKTKLNIYSGVQFHYRNYDDNFEIISIEGIIWFENNFDGCLKKQKEIDKEFKTMFKNTKKRVTGKQSHGQDKSGESKFDAIYYDFKSGDKLSVTCYDWTEEMGYLDNLRVGIITNETQTWINDKAYK